MEPGWITVDTPNGSSRLPCDRIIARMGTSPPRKFVESMGIEFTSKDRDAFPKLSPTFESTVPGIYVIGALAGYPLIKHCMNQGHDVVEYIAGNLTLRPLMLPPLSYDPLRDLATVNHVANYDHLLVVRNSLGVNSVTELIALAKSKPGELTFGSSGTGGPQHMAVELFMIMAGIDMKHIPYKGEAPVVTDLGGDRLDLSIISATAIGSFIKEGRVKALAATNPYRSNTFKDLPTVFEAGLPGYEFESYGGIMAPAGTPKAVIDTLNDAIAKAIASPEVKQKFLDSNLFLLGKGPDEFARFLASERVKWAPIIKKAGAADAS